MKCQMKAQNSGCSLGELVDSLGDEVVDSVCYELEGKDQKSDEKYCLY